MIAEAVDTAVTLGWALLAWIVLMAAVVSLALWTVVVTVWVTVRTVARAVKAACAWSSCHLAASEVSEVIPEGRETPEPAEAPSRPSWARTDEQEAA